MRNAELFEEAVKRASESIGFDDTEDRSIGLWHVLACALDWCDVNKINFDLTLEEVREHFRQNEA